MAKFKPGQSGNPKGRPKGARGKTPEQIRNMVKAFITDHWDEVETDFQLMEPKDKLTAFNNLLKHILPPPVNPDNLTESQMIAVIEYLEKKKRDEQSTTKGQD